MHFRRIFLLLACLCGLTLASAQRVSWNLAARPLETDVWELTLSGDIESGWHIYDLPDGQSQGPDATVISLLPVEGFVWEQAWTPAPAPDRRFDPMFGQTIGTFQGKVDFVSRVRKTVADSLTLFCRVEWMACSATACTPPDEAECSVVLEASEGSAAVAATPAAASLWRLIVEAVLWGLAALLTPCVFPMVPMTVSFFLKRSGDKRRGRIRAAFYGLFIVLLYTLPIAVIILLTRLIGGETVTADIFNWLATHWLPNIIFFIVFMVFAASFFGAFELTLPASVVNGSDRRADRNPGLCGVFFLALTLVLVSFSCTGPIVGTVLIQSTSGAFWMPIVTMLAFSLAFALPFVLLALFPEALKKLPKSGSWLNSVKIVLGFIEIALGFKFLSTADQVYHWGLLDREVYLAIWIVCFTMLGFYLLGKLRFKGDDEVTHVSFLRLALSVAVFSFVVYMIPGMWGAPLKALSGYLPPLQTQDFVLGGETEGHALYVMEEGEPAPERKHAAVLALPFGLDGYFDLEEAEAAARQTGKPLFIDFTGHGCVNCREMEARVWSDGRVLSLLRDEFIICALYTDDKMQLLEDEWVTTESGKVLKQLGKVNAHVALEKYGVNAQPAYVLQSPEGQVLAGPRGYDLDVAAFASWLKSVL